MARTRRAFIAAFGGGIMATSGCTSDPPDREPSDHSPATAEPNGADTEDSADPRTIVIDSETGSPSGAGTADDPFASIGRGLNAASPGDTVRAEPGVYSGPVAVKEGGRPGAPITLTGPADAVLTGGANREQPLLIRASHVRVTGMTIDGLVDPDRPEEPDSYAESPLIDVAPLPDSEAYLNDLVIAPHGMGNAYAHMVVVNRAKNVEIGPIRITGLAGANYVLDEDATGKHVGEFVYLGTPPDTYSLEAYPWDELDQTRNVHVHHIDNSAGHPHAEMVNTKLGTRDVLVEYCTDGGGSQNAEPYPTASIRFQSYDATLRWCELSDGQGHGVNVMGAGADWLANEFEGDVVEPFDTDRLGTDHELYGNRIGGFEGRQMKFDYVYPDDQVLCGNDIDGEIVGPHGDVYTQETCPEDLPDGDGVGHLGGDSPWS